MFQSMPQKYFRCRAALAPRCQASDYYKVYVDNQMEAFQRSWYELKFCLDFRSKNGNAFQDFFSDVMEKRHPGDFQRVKPYGKYGDRKCDGYHASIRMVFQLYAPESMNVAATLAKIAEDFAGALAYWQAQMQAWTFVHNQWRGIPADILNKLNELRDAHRITVTQWGEPELRNIVFALSDPDITALLGEAPAARTVAELGFEDLRPVVNSIAQQEPLADCQVRPVPEDKLEANALSENAKAMLLVGMRKSRLVHRFFSTWHDPQLGDRIARGFRARYEALRDDNIVGDEAFFELWKYAGGSGRATPRTEAAVLAVMAFLFEECEIFEAPRDRAS
jgi:hypothetical protein